MTPNPERVRTTDTVSDAVNKLFELDVRHLPVVNTSEEVVGMLSDRDLRSHILNGRMQYEAPDEVSEEDNVAVSTIMQGDVISLGTDASINDAIELMIEQKIGAIPVVNPLDGTLVGIVSYIDVLRFAAEEL
ncbi:hypothetical protein DN745_17740 [Bradymonas sediminis]|uniref:CBS domain-containing protein n=2 Tax=Bradymonas sediminis TaxID=1548548 RepID=A0A2Z4FQ38_9DELT|nr:hypothetical protein DN745_17740 [Bradymonas sediminis]